MIGDFKILILVRYLRVWISDQGMMSLIIICVGVTFSLQYRCKRYNSWLICGSNALVQYLNSRTINVRYLDVRFSDKSNIFRIYFLRASLKISDYYRLKLKARKWPVRVLRVVPLRAALKRAHNFLTGRPVSSTLTGREWYPYRPLFRIIFFCRPVRVLLNSVRLLLARPISLNGSVTGHGPQAGSNHKSLVRSFF